MRFVVAGCLSLGIAVAVAPLEWFTRVERVIHRTGKYQVVRKVHDAVVAIVRRLDPRTDPA